MALLRRFLPLLRPYRRQAALALLLVLWRPALNTAKVWLLKQDENGAPVWDVTLTDASGAAYVVVRGRGTCSATVLPCW